MYLNLQFENRAQSPIHGPIDKLAVTLAFNRECFYIYGYIIHTANIAVPTKHFYLIYLYFLETFVTLPGGY